MWRLSDEQVKEVNHSAMTEWLKVWLEAMERGDVKEMNFDKCIEEGKKAIAQAQLKHLVEMGSKPCFQHGHALTKRFHCSQCMLSLLAESKEVE